MYFSFEAKKLSREIFSLINLHKAFICLSVLSLTADDIPTKKFPKTFEKEKKVKKKKAKEKEDERSATGEKINYDNNIEDHLHNSGQKGASY